VQSSMDVDQSPPLVIASDGRTIEAKLNGDLKHNSPVSEHDVTVAVADGGRQLAAINGGYGTLTEELV